MRKRKAFEDGIRRNRANISVWLKYAQWEENQKEYERARSVYERALDVDYRNAALWLKYAEMEMKVCVLEEHATTRSEHSYRTLLHLLDVLFTLVL
jgi:hypothetical protein